MLKAVKILFLIFLGFMMPELCEARPQTLKELELIMQQLQPISLPGAITALYRPNYDTILEAELKLSANEPVFVVMFPTGPRIYPQQYMVWHQVVNEVINDDAYAVTYCPITGTLMAYNASMEGLNLIFDVEGHETEGSFYGFLYDGNTILMDRNTGSLWLQELGMAFDGPLLGRGMPTIPVFWTTWEAAKKVFPKAPVLARPRGRRPYGRDPYGNYLRQGSYYDNDQLVYPVHRQDRRFPKKAPMYCLEIGNLLVAIEIEYVKKEGVVNFFMGSEPMLAVYDSRLGVVRVYNRQIWQEPFLFIMRNGKLVDLATDSTWNIETGEAISGNMKGASLKQYFGVYSMWFAWYNLNPETLFVPGPGVVAKDLLKPTPPGMDEKGNYVNPPNLPPDPDKLPGSPTW